MADWLIGLLVFGGFLVLLFGIFIWACIKAVKMVDEKRWKP